jgi:hypothetical protein
MNGSAKYSQWTTRQKDRSTSIWPPCTKLSAGRDHYSQPTPSVIQTGSAASRPLLTDKERAEAGESGSRLRFTTCVDASSRRREPLRGAWSSPGDTLPSEPQHGMHGRSCVDLNDVWNRVRHGLACRTARPDSNGTHLVNPSASVETVEAVGSANSGGCGHEGRVSVRAWARTLPLASTGTTATTFLKSSGRASQYATPYRGAGVDGPAR